MAIKNDEILLRLRGAPSLVLRERIRHQQFIQIIFSVAEWKLICIERDYSIWLIRNYGLCKHILSLSEHHRE